jgi:hypothetical protein
MTLTFQVNLRSSLHLNYSICLFGGKSRFVFFKVKSNLYINNKIMQFNQNLITWSWQSRSFKGQCQFNLFEGLVRNVILPNCEDIPFINYQDTVYYNKNQWKFNKFTFKVKVIIQPRSIWVWYTWHSYPKECSVIICAWRSYPKECSVMICAWRSYPKECSVIVWNLSIQ